MSTPDEAVELALAHGLPYAGLRDAVHDASVVPEEAARAARVVALRAGPDRVRLAAAEPEPDLSALRPHLGDRRAEIVIAAADEIDAILGPAPEPAAEPEPEPAPEAGPETPPADEPGEEPSWLAPAPERSTAAAIAIVVLAFVVVAGLLALAVWLIA